jgi:hypothetical protein
MTRRSAGRRKGAIRTVVAVALLAFTAVPALASASPVLKDSKGTLAVGTQIAATNIGNIKFVTSIATVECQTGALTGNVAKNNGTEVGASFATASFTGTGSGGKCTTSFLGDVGVVTKRLPWCLRAGGNIAKDTLLLTSLQCSGGGLLEFTFNNALAGECTYVMNFSAGGSFTTGTGVGTRAELGLFGQEFEQSGGGILCPGSGYIQMKFNLETNDASKLPIWIE